MNVIGIIAEYNPFHNGHLYQINKIKQEFFNSIIIVIISSSFTQRGEISTLDKWTKANICIDMGIDIVIELPSIYTIQSADIFAKESIYLLSKLKIDTLVFGTESIDINKLINIANLSNRQQFNDKVKLYLKEGFNYPTALSKSIYDTLGYTVNTSNDILAISYLKELGKYNINPFNIIRTTSYKGNDIKNNITSATNIRNMLYNKEDISKYIPPYNINSITKINNNDIFNYLKYKILSSDNLSIYHLVNEGIDNRIKKCLSISNSWDELVNNINTKRYTYPKINRILMNILLDIKKEDIKTYNNDYLRLLRISQRGQQYLNTIKKNLDLPILTSYKHGISKLLDKEINISKLYSLFTNNESVIDKEYNCKPK